ncbi:hypothetical protein BHU72_04475 [Desulfuribacillus stibiiarsenatis]|uniref:DUF8173 domain-containing protein n=1 Tax=Desulfuribacillus stibiiarsenatis TaxID=1390249 RepID=A0A1E5L5L6_9FIRM|nr:polymer-forming cytoskeletal protein [Desulfuribacillus stibiiarsenatis]OEH85354.1 hypothetical protein BHU72_04475 [Desulfuribacillus stibiiarsenatis]
MERKWARRSLKVWGMLILMVIGMTTIVFATPMQLQSGDVVEVEAGQLVKGPVFYGGNNIRISGDIMGTGFIAGGTVQIDGTVDGDLFVAGQQVVLNGVITGNLYIAGMDLQINGQILGDVFSAGQKIHLSKDSVVERDFLAAGETIFSSGNLGRQFFGAGTNIVLAGTVQDDVRIAADRLEIRDNAVIEGDLTYTSSKEAIIGTNATLAGVTEWKLPEPTYNEREQQTSIIGTLFAAVSSIIAAILVWFALSMVIPSLWKGTSEPLQKTPFRTLGLGVMILIGTPIIAIIAMVTVVGLPLGLIIMAMYTVGIYITKIIVATAIGYMIAKKFGWNDIHQGFWLVLLGLIILKVLSFVPIVRVIVSIAVILGGLGAILIFFLNRDNKEEVPIEEISEY